MRASRAADAGVEVERGKNRSLREQNSEETRVLIRQSLKAWELRVALSTGCCGICPHAQQRMSSHMARGLGCMHKCCMHGNIKWMLVV